MTIEDFFRLLLRNALLLIAALVVGTGAGYGLSYTQPEVYQATSLGFVRDASGAGTTTGDSTPTQYSKAQFYLPLFGTRTVRERIEQQIGAAEAPVAGPWGIEATLDPNAAIITVTASADSPEHATSIANAAVEAVATEADTLEPGAGSQLVAYQSALQPSAPVAPDRKKFAAIGGAAGLLLGLAIAWLRNRNDSRIRTVEDIRTAVAVPSLGVLPDTKDLGREKHSVLRDPQQFHSREALRKLRTNLRYADVDNPPRSIVVTSSAPGEGKSTVAANLARVLARSGQRTLLIDADLRRPIEAAQFGLDGSVGLSQLLAGSVQLADVLQEDPHSPLSILPAGEVPPNPSELLGSRRMHELVAALAPEYFIIIDAPPILAVTDAQLLSRHTDGAIIVAVPGRTRVEAITRAVESIRGVGGTVYGAVMNRASTSRLSRIAYGDAEYGYSAHGYSSRSYSRAYGAMRPVGDEHTLEAFDETAPDIAPEPPTAPGLGAPEASGRRRAGADAADPEDTTP